MTEEISYYGGNTSNDCHVARGGADYAAGSTYPACYRAASYTSYTGFHIGFRVVLYMK